MNDDIQIHRQASPSAEDFPSRRKALEQICQRLRQSSLSSSHVVGGPLSGKTLLLQHLASPAANDALGEVAGSVRAYVDAGLLGAKPSPQVFWYKVCRELRLALGRIQTGENDELMRSIAAAELLAKKGEIDVFALEDLCDAFGRSKRPAILLVDDLDAIIQLPGFLPPSEFFDEIRALCQRTPRGVAFVATSRRPLSEIGSAAVGPSPFYNHFLTIPLLALDEMEITKYLEHRAEVEALTLPTTALSLVSSASSGHPYLVDFCASTVLAQVAAGSMPDAEPLKAAMDNPDGPFSRLQGLILDSLTALEREAVSAASEESGMTTAHRATLQRLQRTGLLPPGLGPVS
jgi:hypothetical protein